MCFASFFFTDGINLMDKENKFAFISLSVAFLCPFIETRVIGEDSANADENGIMRRPNRVAEPQ